jgi:hypothetical protein
MTPAQQRGSGASDQLPPPEGRISLAGEAALSRSHCPSPCASKPSQASVGLLLCSVIAASRRLCR